MESLADFLGLNLPEAPADAKRITYSIDPPRAARLGIRERARAILQSPEYFESILLRIRCGTLPPAVELRFYDEAYGKPVERFEIKDTTDDIDNMNAEQLEQEAMRLIALAKQIRQDQPQEQERGSVH